MIFERLIFIVCERWVGDKDRLLYWPKFFWPKQLFFLILSGLLNRGSLKATKSSVCKLILTLASSPQLTRTVCALVILLFNVRPLLLFYHLLTQVHLMIDGSVEGQYITLGGFLIAKSSLKKNNRWSDEWIYSILKKLVRSWTLYRDWSLNSLTRMSKSSTLQYLSLLHDCFVLTAYRPFSGHLTPN